MTDLPKLTLAAALDGLSSKAFSSRELTEAFIQEIEASNDTLNAYVVKTPEKALEMADAADAKIAAGEARALEGAPIGVKDLYCTKGVRTTACSNILGEFTPTYESTVTQQLWDRGAVMLGKLNMDEFAMGSSNETSVYGNAVNPWRRGNDETALTPGGSSGGRVLLARWGGRRGGAGPGRAHSYQSAATDHVLRRIQFRRNPDAEFAFDEDRRLPVVGQALSGIAVADRRRSWRSGVLLAFASFTLDAGIHAGGVGRSHRRYAFPTVCPA